MSRGRTRVAATVAAVVLSVFVVGCAPENVLEPTRESQASSATAPQLGGGITPMCQLGCLDSTPNPEAPGLYLGSGVTPDLCVGGGQSDNDGDGLSTFCENSIAAAFAPELRYAWGDEVGREPYWAARPASSSDAHTVTIAYLISYYLDTGSTAWGCSLPWAAQECAGHNGDSEAIILQVYYDDVSENWVLGRATYSQHLTYGVFKQGMNGYPAALTYPMRAGAYPRSYVAVGKHANYQSVSACNAGALGATDDCNHVDTSERIYVSGGYNVGSSASRLIDCVPSRDPSYIYYGSGRQECDWSSNEFRGWIPTSIGGTAAEPGYGARLTSFGF